MVNEFDDLLSDMEWEEQDNTHFICEALKHNGCTMFFVSQDDMSDTLNVDTGRDKYTLYVAPRSFEKEYMSWDEYQVLLRVDIRDNNPPDTPTDKYAYVQFDDFREDWKDVLANLEITVSAVSYIDVTDMDLMRESTTFVSPEVESLIRKHVLDFILERA